MSLATMRRRGPGDQVVLLHGFGCAKESFLPLWDEPRLRDASLLAIDLPGHGQSQTTLPEACTMESMAQAVADTLRHAVIAGRRLHLVAHSMGGAVGLLLARQTDLPLASFVSIEGNLVAADCGLLSRRIAETELEELRAEKLDSLKSVARKSEDPNVRRWAGWMESCTARTLHASAGSLVQWSDSGRLLEIFLGLTVRTAYVHGDRSGIADVLGLLSSVPVHEVAECGHFVMSDKPSELAGIIASVMAGRKRN